MDQTREQNKYKCKSLIVLLFVSHKKQKVTIKQLNQDHANFDGHEAYIIQFRYTFEIVEKANKVKTKGWIEDYNDNFKCIMYSN